MRTRKQLALLPIIFGLFWMQMGAPVAASYRVTDLGVLPDATDSEAYGINNRGLVVGSSGGNGFRRAFLYDGMAMNDLGALLDRQYSKALAINDGGQVIGYAWDASLSSRAFLYDGNTHDLGTLGGNQSLAHDINSSGQVVGWASTISGARHAFLYDGVMRDLGTLTGGTWSVATAINDNGQVVGFADTSAGDTHAFLYDGTMRDLGTLGGNYSKALDINNSGCILGMSQRDSGANRPFLYDGTIEDLGIEGEVYSINNRGDILGYLGSTEGPYPFLASGRQVIYLNEAMDSFWWDYEAIGLNDTGQIIGNGTNFNYEQHALLMTPVPEPSSALCIGAGLLSLGGLGLTARKRMMLPSVSIAACLVVIGAGETLSQLMERWGIGYLRDLAEGSVL